MAIHLKEKKKRATDVAILIRHKEFDLENFLNIYDNTLPKKSFQEQKERQAVHLIHKENANFIFPS